MWVCASVCVRASLSTQTDDPLEAKLFEVHLTFSSGCISNQNSSYLFIKIEI